MLALGVTLAACGSDTTTTPPAGECDDRVEPTIEVPAPTRARLAEHGITAVVGEGDVWFVAPVAPHWSALVTAEGDAFGAKLALWVDRAGPLPAVTVRALGDGPDAGTATPSPTADGLPGPVPVGVRFPAAGCWAVEAQGRDGTARVVIAVG